MKTTIAFCLVLMLAVCIVNASSHRVVRDVKPEEGAVPPVEAPKGDDAKVPPVGETPTTGATSAADTTTTAATTTIAAA